jgi:hypothetical protein
MLKYLPDEHGNFEGGACLVLSIQLTIHIKNLGEKTHMLAA